MLVGDKKTQSFYIRSSSLDTRYFQLMVSILYIKKKKYFTIFEHNLYNYLKDLKH